MLMIPAPIRTDESNGFAHHTMRVRIPAIIRETIRLNPDYSTTVRKSLEKLARDSEKGAALPPVRPDYPDAEGWEQAVRQRKGATWHNVEWFFAETYIYRQLVDRVNWWDTGRDPFAPKKQAEINGAALWQTLDEALSISIDEKRSLHERLAALLQYALWGNRIDLSYAVAASHGAQWAADDLLVDDTEAVVQRFVTAKQIDFIIDNAGTELAMDLVLADALLTAGVEQVVFHAKSHPTFVSDTIPADVSSFVNRLYIEQNKQRQQFGERLQTVLNDFRLDVQPHLFWNSHHFLWELAPETPLYRKLQRSDLVISKGDANYRRITGDAVWEAATPFSEVVGYFPTPLAALRTLKSDPVVGLASGVAEQLDRADPSWRVNGRRGVIQLTQTLSI
jgi:uncharacterized protein with ATP-grasp and redox domains